MSTLDKATDLQRLHADPDNAFYNWNGPWLDPEFRKWDITDALAHIRVPVLIVQGENDRFGMPEPAQGREVVRVAGDHGLKKDHPAVAEAVVGWLAQLAS